MLGRLQQIPDTQQLGAEPALERDTPYQQPLDDEQPQAVTTVRGVLLGVPPAGVTA